MEFFGQIGFSLSFIAYLVFTLLIFAARNKSVLAKWTIVSALSTALASGLSFLQVKMGFSLQWVMLADGLKLVCWSVMVLICNTELTSIRRLLSNYHIRQYLSISSVLIITAWGATYFLNFSYEYLFLLFIVLNLWILVLIEQLYRSADDQIRWAIWPLVIALASVSIFDFVLYAQATMVGGIDFDFWYSRGYIALAIVPLLLISTRRVKNGSVRIFVSRQVVFYSSILMMAGIYLLVMALAGYVINYIGGEWGSFVSIGFLIFSGVVLVTLLITDTLRKKLKVFILTASCFLFSAAIISAQVPTTDIYLFSVEKTSDKYVFSKGKNITNRAGYDNQPSFSVDGKHIFFTSSRRENNFDIYKYTLATGAVSPVVTSDANEYSAKQVDENRVAFVREGKDQLMTVFYLDLNTKTETPAFKVKDPIAYYEFNKNGDALVWVRYAFWMKWVNSEKSINRYVANYAQPSVPHLIPVTDKFSFMQRHPDDSLWIKEFNPATESVRPIVQAKDGNKNYCWMRDGSLLMSSESKLFRFDEKTDKTWVEVADLKSFGIMEITRIATSPDGKNLAVVSNQ